KPRIRPNTPSLCQPTDSIFVLYSQIAATLDPAIKRKLHPLASSGEKPEISVASRVTSSLLPGTLNLHRRVSVTQ
ncbi:MAG: hypothetical protein KTR32_24965, partial [Granulosicoccus sp.]|nr:hypothetical protein [Granulosicoccus sp.]